MQYLFLDICTSATSFPKAAWLQALVSAVHYFLAFWLCDATLLWLCSLLWGHNWQNPVMGASCHTYRSICVSPASVSKEMSENMSTPNDPPKRLCKQAGLYCNAVLVTIVAYVMPTDKMKSLLSHGGKDGRGPAAQRGVLAVLIATSWDAIKIRFYKAIE